MNLVVSSAIQKDSVVITVAIVTELDELFIRRDGCLTGSLKRDLMFPSSLYLFRIHSFGLYCYFDR